MDRQPDSFGFYDSETQQGEEQLYQDYGHDLHESGGSSLPETQQQRKFKSEVWQHFNANYDDKGVLVSASCKHCQNPKLYSFLKSNSTSALKRHIERVHPSLLGIESNQTQLTGSASSSSQLFKYNPQVDRQEFAKMLAAEQLPFAFCQRKSYVAYVKNNLQPSYKNVSRTTISRETKNTYKSLKKELIDTLASVNHKMTICSDIWSDSINHNSYLGITVHWIDSNWELQKRLISYKLLEDSHTGVNIAEWITESSYEYGIRNKIFAVGFDNASNNTRAIEDLKDNCFPELDGLFFS